MQTPNFQLQYLLQHYSKNLTIVLEPFTGVPCEWVDADLGVLWEESEQILHLKIGCPNFGPVRGSATHVLTYLQGRDALFSL